jgi:hypothetical protein
MMRFRWTKERIDEMTSRTAEGEPATAIAASFGCLDHRTVVRKQFALGLKTPHVAKPWTRREEATVRRLYPIMSTKKLAAKMGRTECSVNGRADKLGVKKSLEYLASPDACRLRRGDEIGKEFRFKKGIVPHNTGLRRPGYAPGRMADTQFKKGQRTGKAAENWMPLGSIRADGEGYLRIKVREGTKGEAYGFGNTKIWPLLARHVWEKHKGPIPPGHKIVFKDRDRSNCAIENLELISSGDLMRRNTIHNYPPRAEEHHHAAGRN